MLHNRIMKTLLKTTRDGSHTLFVPELEEHYHSIHGAIQEALHVFINAGFLHCIKSSIQLLEIGFGTGLNALLTLLAAESMGKKVHYHTLEHYPLQKESIMQLNHPKQIVGRGLFSKKQTLAHITQLFRAIHKAPWEAEQSITPFFKLTKEKFDITQIELFNPKQQYDLIYFDAFGPDKQPEMWQSSIFNRIYSLSAQNAVFTTYCAKGAVRRMLQSSGFSVERIPGPPGKREMLRAAKQSG